MLDMVLHVYAFVSLFVGACGCLFVSNVLYVITNLVCWVCMRHVRSYMGLYNMVMSFGVWLQAFGFSVCIEHICYPCVIAFDIVNFEALFLPISYHLQFHDWFRVTPPPRLFNVEIYKHKTVWVDYQ